MTRVDGESRVEHPQVPPRRPPRYRWAIALYDRLYRSLHRLDTPAARVGPAFCVEVRRARGDRRLADGVVVTRGDRIGVLHLNNDRIVTLHVNGASPVAVGLEFRRQLVASLSELAVLAAPGGRLHDVRAFAATTIFHRGLVRLGFRPDPDDLAWPRLVGAYQRALLASLHPRGPVRVQGAAYQCARRLWLSREVLLVRYGRGARPAPDGGDR
jgi:hypothetical protein